MNHTSLRIALLAFFVTFQVSASEETYNFSDLVDEDQISTEQIIQKQELEDEAGDIEDQRELMSKKDKILIVGDSWATFPCFYNSMGKMIRDLDANIVEDNRCWRTTKLGMTGFDWIGSKQDLRTFRYIERTKRLKYMYLSLGGNDLMAIWNKDFTAEQELAAIHKVMAQVKEVMDRYHAIRPDLKIILSGYDFPHFTPNHTIGLYRKIFDRIGRPPHERTNRALAKLCQHMAKLANGKNIFYVQHMGLSQYYDGVPEFGLEAGKTLAPDMISPIKNPSVIGGDVRYPSSQKSMINWIIAKDAFHLSNKMYRRVMHHTYNNVLRHVVQQDQGQSSVLSSE